MKRLLGLIVLLGVASAGLYYWRSRPEAPVRLDGVRLPKPVAAVKGRLGDAALHAAVQGAFALNRRLAPLGLSVEVEDGVVTLRGDAPDSDTREAATRVAAQVPGARDVRSQIRIAAPRPAPSEGRSLGEALDDEKLALQVRLAFSLDRRLKGLAIDVAVTRGAVRLSGDVESVEVKDLARQVAGDVRGVASVTDTLRVTGHDARRP